MRVEGAASAFFVSAIVVAVVAVAADVDQIDGKDLWQWERRNSNPSSRRMQLLRLTLVVLVSDEHVRVEVETGDNIIDDDSSIYVSTLHMSCTYIRKGSCLLCSVRSTKKTSGILSLLSQSQEFLHLARSSWGER